MGRATPTHSRYDHGLQDRLAVLQSPARYTQGRHATRSLGAELQQVGLSGPVLILTSSAPQRLLADTWEQSLNEAGITYQIELFGGECTLAEIDRIGAIAKAAGSNVIVGAGGGKVLDTSRAVAANLDLAAVNCPTTASSDAPCSALSVVYTETGAFAEYRFYPANPRLVLVDSAVVAQAPTRLLVSGIGDALATWWEAKTVREAYSLNQLGGVPTQTGTALARLCFDLLLANGADAVRAATDNVVTPALEKIIEANTLLSGLGFESGGLAAAHSVHNGLTTQPETHEYLHGEKVSFGLIAQLVLEGRPRADLDEVLGLSVGIGLPVTLGELGIPNPSVEQIRTIATRSLADGETIHNEPFEVSVADLSDAIIAADASGRASQA